MRSEFRKFLGIGAAHGLQEMPASRSQSKGLLELPSLYSSLEDKLGALQLGDRTSGSSKSSLLTTTECANISPGSFHRLDFAMIR